MTTLYVKNPTKLNTSDLNDKLDKMIARAKLNYRFITAILETTKKFEGKTISRRFYNEVVKNPVFEGYTTYYRTEHGMFNIIVWGNDIEYGNSFSSLICYDTDKVITYATVSERNQCYILEAERAVKYENAKEKTNDWVHRWNEALDDLQVVYDEAGSFGVSLSSN